MKPAFRFALGALALFSSPGCVFSLRPAATSRSSTVVAPVDTGDAQSPVQPYDKVIPHSALTTRGLFITHRVRDKLYFEIPRAELGGDMLLVGRLARSTNDPATSSYGGDEFTERVLRWERQGDRIILRSPSYELMADTALPVYQAVENSNYPSVVAVFDVDAYGVDSAPVIDVSRLYTTSIPEFSGSRATIDETRSFIEKAIALPANVEIEATQTYTPESNRSSDSAGPTTAASVVAHWSMVELPAQPMAVRLADTRVSYFSVSHTDYGTTEHRAAQRTFITRWRLEKKNPDAPLSDPVQPIIFYLDPATPARWREFIRQGVEEWLPAFAEAGFTNAIVVRDAPAPNSDAEWSQQDIRHNMIRWIASTAENAFGPNVHDPRTGEILNASISIHHNILNQERNWYFTQVAPLDPRARRLPFPDSLMGRLLQSVVAHEVGHTLGLQHNTKGSSTYPADSVRSATWVHRMGFSPTLMDYVRYDYVAQPEDHLDVNDLVPRVGPYDRFAIMWGYKPIRGASTPDAEASTLDSWAREQDVIPWLRSSTSGSGGADYGDESEAVGDADAVKSTGYGLRNIRRVVPLLIPATETSSSANADLETLYNSLVDQWSTELTHVANVVGGDETREKWATQRGVRFAPLPRSRQKAALRFLDENAFQTPAYLLDEQILRRLEPEGELARLRTAQDRVLSALLDPSRMTRMVEDNALAPPGRDLYTLAEMLSDLRIGIWSETENAGVRIDAFRRNLQRSYLDRLASALAPGVGLSPGDADPGGRQAIPADARALLRAELSDLDAMIRAAIPRSADRETRAHLIDARAEIDRILNPGR